MARFRRVQTISHDIGANGTLVLSVTSADVRLTAVAGDQAQVLATFEVIARNDAEADELLDAAKLEVEMAPGQLHVTEPSSSWGLGSAFDRLVVDRFFRGQEVELREVEASAPPGCVLDVHVVSGDAQASGFQGEQRFQSVSGDMRLTDAGGDVNVDSVSGDISLRAVEPVSLKVNNVSGDLSAQAPTFEGLRIQSVSGDVSVDGDLGDATPYAVDTVSGDFRLASTSGVTVAVRGMSSDIHSALPHRLEGTADRRRLIVGDGAASVAFNSMSGDLAVTRSRQQPHPTAAGSEQAAPAGDADRIAVLGALERGEIDVDEAMRRLGHDA